MLGISPLCFDRAPCMVSLSIWVIAVEADDHIQEAAQDCTH